MRTSIAYFAGAGTVIVALAAGLGGGLVISNMASPSTRTLGKVELQAKAQSSQQIAAQSPQLPQPPTPSQSGDAQAPQPYLAQTARAADAPVVISPAPQQPQQQAEEKPPISQPPQRTAEIARESTKDSAKGNFQVATNGGDQASRSENAYARARDADLKRLDDRQKVEQRRQQSAMRHQRDREQELRDVEREVRANTGSRQVIVRRDDDSDGPDFDRSSADRPTPFPFPHLNLFGSD